MWQLNVILLSLIDFYHRNLMPHLNLYSFILKPNSRMVEKTEEKKERLFSCSTPQKTVHQHTACQGRGHGRGQPVNQQAASRFDGDCRYGAHCKFLHVCTTCKGDHPVMRWTPQVGRGKGNGSPLMQS